MAVAKRGKEMKRFFLNAKGLTLSEILIVMFLITLVLAVIYPLYFFGSDSFALSHEQFLLQSDARIAADTIVQNVRYASEVEIIPYTEVADKTRHKSGYDYFYLVDGKLYHSQFEEESGRRQIKVYATSLENHAELFEKTDDAMLGIKLYIRRQRQKFQVETEIFLPNLARAQAAIIDKTSKNELKGLKYRSKGN